MIRHLTRVATPLASLAMFASTAFAGPLLVCHAYEIGNARSLPWHDSREWSGERSDYSLQHLIADTEALLTPSVPIVVRMETLRRAALYASHDAQLAKQLLDRVHARLDSTRASDTMALLDAAYLTATFRQIAMLRDYETDFRERGANVARLDGLDRAPQLIERALAQQPDDVGVTFAAALIASAYSTASYEQYAKAARLTMTRDALVARNITLLR